MTTLIDQIKTEIARKLENVQIDGFDFKGLQWSVGTAWNQDNPNQDYFSVSGTVYKLDEEKQIVYGFASVIEVDGEQLVDKHGDVIEEDDLIEAAHTFMSEYRSGKEMHKGADVGEVVESIVFTKDLQKALGIDLGGVGWFVGYKVHKKEVWEKVKSGELAMFSIGGTATKETIE